VAFVEHDLDRDFAVPGALDGGQHLGQLEIVEDHLQARARAVDGLDQQGGDGFVAREGDRRKGRPGDLRNRLDGRDIDSGRLDFRGRLPAAVEERVQAAAADGGSRGPRKRGQRRHGEQRA